MAQKDGSCPFEKYYKSESEELDDYCDDNDFDFGEPYYETD